MALTEATPQYKVEINPDSGLTRSETNLQGGSNHFVRLTPTNVNAIRLLLDKIKAGVDVSTVVTAINAL